MSFELDFTAKATTTSLLFLFIWSIHHPLVLNKMEIERCNTNLHIGNKNNNDVDNDEEVHARCHPCSLLDECVQGSYQGMVSPSSQLMKDPVLSMVMRLISWMTLFAPMLGSTAPSSSQMAWYLLVMSVRLKPGCRMDTLTPEAFSSCDRSMPAMLAAALDMWWP